MPRADRDTAFGLRSSALQKSFQAPAMVIDWWETARRETRAAVKSAQQADFVELARTSPARRLSWINRSRANASVSSTSENVAWPSERSESRARFCSLRDR